MTVTKLLRFASWAAFPLLAATALTIGCLGEEPASPTPASVPSGGPPPEDGGVPAVAPDAAPSIGCPLGCLAPAIGGWTGPSAVYDGNGADKPAACPLMYTVKEIEGVSGASTAGPATCSCGAPVGPNAKCRVTISSYIDDVCAQSPVDETVTVPDTTCFNSGRVTMKVKSVAVDQGSCTYPRVTMTGAPAPTFERSAVACGLPQFATCTSRPDCVAAPIPDPPFRRLCIFKAGDESCPSLDYPARFVTNQEVVDDRGCAGCTGTPSGASCGAAITSFAPLFNCQGGGTAGNLSTCAPAGSLGLAGLGPSGGACPAGVPQTTGAVTARGPVTFCCTR